MKMLLALPLLIAGCSLTPAQLKALDGVVCNHVKTFGVENTTVAVGGASKPTNTAVGADCTTIIQGVAVKP